MKCRTLFHIAAAPLAILTLVLTSTAKADDDLLTRLAAAESATSQDVASIDEAEMGLNDVESLLSDGESADTEEAVAACYRRFGSSYGYSSYHYGGFSNYRYSTFYPSYHRSYYTRTYYTPVTYTYYSPVYTSYWGCW